MSLTQYFRGSVACFVCVASIVFAATMRAGENFSRDLNNVDYEAAGLGKLSDAERAKLDQLVKSYSDGAYQRGQIAAQSNEPTQTSAGSTSETSVAASTPAPVSKPEKPKKAKVKVDPGTEIEYNTMDSELVGTFEGFEKGTIFTLANGQRWKVTDGSYVCGPDPRVKNVRVKPGLLGAFFLEFERVSVRAKAQLLK